MCKVGSGCRLHQSVKQRGGQELVKGVRGGQVDLFYLTAAYKNISENISNQERLRVGYPNLENI